MIKSFLYKTYYRMKDFQIEKEYFPDTDTTFFQVMRLPNYEEVYDKKLRTELIKEVNDSND